MHCVNRFADAYYFIVQEEGFDDDEKIFRATYHILQEFSAADCDTHSFDIRGGAGNYPQYHA